ncbi:hypothetical protein DOTSEDRAFT_69616 [Dothistroma septosporum NZE10]|uniref:Uncharacterized protein n=1 Tax=Dothistroma septosporum (strain NZE10 / CBS 128990) TaxID=675120 RepID=N1PZC6_DOTSN|nr:hypothetical protein DOTSEDRAFT_69616 [Dothistroma septosporum NZE10]
MLSLKHKSPKAGSPVQQGAYPAKQDKSVDQGTQQPARREERSVESQEVVVIVRHFGDKKARLKGKDPVQVKEGTGEVDGEMSLTELYRELRQLALLSVGMKATTPGFHGSLLIQAPGHERVALVNEQDWKQHRGLLKVRATRLMLDFDIDSLEVKETTKSSSWLDKARGKAMAKVAMWDDAIKREKSAQQEQFNNPWM